VVWALGLWDRGVGVGIVGSWCGRWDCGIVLWALGLQHGGVAIWEYKNDRDTTCHPSEGWDPFPLLIVSLAIVNLNDFAKLK
jgi:hypothetical protein